MPGRAQPERGGCMAAQPAAGRHHRHQRCGKLLRLGAALLSVHRVPHAARPHQRSDGLRRSRCGCRQAHASGSDRGVLLGRWRLPDDRAGTGHGGAVRCRGGVLGRQQRDVRHDSHAPGARLSGAHLRHRAAQPGFRPAGACLWSARSCGGDRRPSSRRRSKRRWPPAFRRYSSCASIPTPSRRAPA